MGLPRRLHGFTAVAELKYAKAVSLLSPASCLHGFTAVAELKYPHPPARAAPARRLHGFTAVAELKSAWKGVRVNELLVSTASPPWPN